MNILVTGGTGFVGSHLVKKLREDNHNVYILSRSMGSEGDRYSKNRIVWDKCYQIKNMDDVPQLDFVINLMGENLANKRWSETQKKEIRDSRVIATKELIKQLDDAQKLPKRWIQASAIGIYPKNRDEIFDEDSQEKDKDFLSSVCIEWERVLRELPQDVHSQIVRIGLVLGKDGGLVKKLLPLFKMNLGSKLSSGHQKMSWIHVEDLVKVIVHLVDNKEVKLINGVSEVNTNREFTDALCEALNKFQGPPVPSFALKLMMGEMSTLALDGQEVRSKYLLDLKHKDIKEMFKKELA